MTWGFTTSQPRCASGYARSCPPDGSHPCGMMSLFQSQAAKPQRRVPERGGGRETDCSIHEQRSLSPSVHLHGCTRCNGRLTIGNLWRVAKPESRPWRCGSRTLHGPGTTTRPRPSRSSAGHPWARWRTRPSASWRHTIHRLRAFRVLDPYDGVCAMGVTPNAVTSCGLCPG